MEKKTLGGDIEMIHNHITSVNNVKYFYPEAREYLFDNDGHDCDYMLLEFQNLMMKYGIRNINLMYDALNTKGDYTNLKELHVKYTINNSTSL